MPREDCSTCWWQERVFGVHTAGELWVTLQEKPVLLRG